MIGFLKDTVSPRPVVLRLENLEDLLTHSWLGPTPQFLIQEIWGVVWTFAFLTSFGDADIADNFVKMMHLTIIWQPLMRWDHHESWTQFTLAFVTIFSPCGSFSFTVLFKCLVSLEDILPSIGHGFVPHVKKLECLLKTIAAVTLIKQLPKLFLKPLMHM